MIIFFYYFLKLVTYDNIINKINISIQQYLAFFFSLKALMLYNFFILGVDIISFADKLYNN